uniref:Sorting nexin/Vps5-like C-terminal domain-containing protein n=1 Tax=Trichobilharzia regenti TaxID=157069 RepID=A0AA85IV56_TRIRE|nr:unnamed protein product [Trichobilharzia regenti]
MSFFYQKADELDTWEKQLKRLYSSLLALVSGDNDLANAKVGLSRSILLLANVDENTGLAQALHQLADTEGHVAELHALQAEAHTCHLAEYTKEVLGMVQACKKSECRSPVVPIHTSKRCVRIFRQFVHKLQWCLSLVSSRKNMQLAYFYSP